MKPSRLDVGVVAHATTAFVSVGDGLMGGGLLLLQQYSGQPSNKLYSSVYTSHVAMYTVVGNAQMSAAILLYVTQPRADKLSRRFFFLCLVVVHPGWSWGSVSGVAVV